MPIYEYKCEQGHVFDTMQKMSEDPLTDCVECGAPVKKLMQPVGISFKGSGFYSTDYKSVKPATPAGSGNGDSSSSQNTSDGSNASKTSESSNGSSSDGSSSDSSSKETSKSSSGSGGASKSE